MKTSKFRGVSWKTQAKRWCVKLVVSDLHVYVGEFIDEIPAAKAYDMAAPLAFGVACQSTQPVYRDE